MDSYSIPDRFVVQVGNQIRIDTQYVGTSNSVAEVNAVLTAYGFTTDVTAENHLSRQWEDEFSEGGGCYVGGRQGLCSSDGNSLGSHAEVLGELLSNWAGAGDTDKTLWRHRDQ